MEREQGEREGGGNGGGEAAAGLSFVQKQALVDKEEENKVGMMR